ncbi:hypothetical protein PL373_08085 [Tenacibaculum maritimum]|nr:hypothetical protein [Tenacibaculum maritimum]MDB0601104.1 hypothetical protein [Tenacibaculum maritimum]MDB0612186.1 hypothetical protein [Tenacibaculum maritimum]
MSKVTIRPITDTSLSVRKKVVHKDMEDNWVAVSELSQSETKAFALYKADYLDMDIKPLPELTYTI